MKEWFRINQHRLSGNWDLWVIMKKPFDRQNAAEVEELFLENLNRINQK
jgi:ribonuclease P protein component